MALERGIYSAGTSLAIPCGINSAPSPVVGAGTSLAIWGSIINSALQLKFFRVPPMGRFMKNKSSLFRALLVAGFYGAIGAACVCLVGRISSQSPGSPPVPFVHSTIRATNVVNITITEVWEQANVAVIDGGQLVHFPQGAARLASRTVVTNAPAVVNAEPLKTDKLKAEALKSVQAAAAEAPNQKPNPKPDAAKK